MHIACPDKDNCGSSDGYCIDEKGKGYCFSCQKGFNNGSVDFEDEKENERYDTGKLSNLKVGGAYQFLKDRGISRDTCEFFDVKVVDGVYVFNYKDSKGQIKAQKVRNVDQKRFSWLGSPKETGLFGADKFKGGNTITIVGGEFDAMAFREMAGDYPVVSVKNGENTLKDIKENLDYFKNFKKVYICLDNDKTGREYATKYADLFPVGKAKIVTLRHFKDPNDYLLNGAKKQFLDCWWAAVDYTPAGIEAANAGGFESLFDDVDNLQLFPFPFDGLNAMCFGIRFSEMVTLVSGSGVGKSANVGEIAYKLHMETDEKVGMLMLEEAPRKTRLRMMSLYLNKPLHLTLLGRLKGKFDFLDRVLSKLFKNKEAYEWKEETKVELKDAWDNVIEKKAPDGEQKLWFFNHFGSNGIDTIVNRIDAMVTGLGCKFIFLDHISIVVSDQENADERKALDELATKLRTLVERRNFGLIIVSHLRRPNGKPHEEGGETSLADIRGTAGIGQLSDIVIGFERNGQHSDEYLRNVTLMRVLKNRFAGFTGPAAAVWYNGETGRLEEIDLQETQRALAGEVSDDDDEPKFEDESENVFDNTPFGKLEEERKVG
jgi:twinkle protein